MILWSSYLVIKEAVLILLEAVPSEIDFDRVHQALLRGAARATCMTFISGRCRRVKRRSPVMSVLIRRLRCTGRRL